MLIETSGSNISHDEEKLNNFLDQQMNKGVILDGCIVNEPSKIHVSYCICCICGTMPFMKKIYIIDI